MQMLRAGVPLTLLIDLATAVGIDSAEILAVERDATAPVEAGA
jgi:hypothetical protein